jgi:hypothetical protein
MGQLFNACDYLLDRRLAEGNGRGSRSPVPSAT